MLSILTTKNSFKDNLIEQIVKKEKNVQKGPKLLRVNENRGGPPKKTVHTAPPKNQCAPGTTSITGRYSLFSFVHLLIITIL